MKPGVYLLNTFISYDSRRIHALGFKVIDLTYHDRNVLQYLTQTKFPPTIIGGGNYGINDWR